MLYPPITIAQPPHEQRERLAIETTAYRAVRPSSHHLPSLAERRGSRIETQATHALSITYIRYHAAQPHNRTSLRRESRRKEHPITHVLQTKDEDR